MKRQVIHTSVPNPLLALLLMLRQTSRLITGKKTKKKKEKT